LSLQQEAKSDESVMRMDDSLSIDAALMQHYAAHGLPADGGETKQWFVVRLGPLRLRLPNPPSRRKVVFLHDINHVLTEYDTSFGDGEMQIAAFEIGSGCGQYLTAWWFNLVMLNFSVWTRPHSAFRAFVRGRRCLSIYHSVDSRDALKRLSVAELKRRLLIARDVGRATLTDRMQFTLWSVVALIVLASAPGVMAIAVLLSAAQAIKRHA
jgi:hypothetical protein